MGLGINGSLRLGLFGEEQSFSEPFACPHAGSPN
ncbi:Uncharacterised protein [Escherichia coli]|nr:Uncharacterised protein [Escherichia coli]